MAESVNYYMDILDEYIKIGTDVYPNSSDFWQFVIQEGRWEIVMSFFVLTFRFISQPG